MQLKHTITSIYTFLNIVYNICQDHLEKKYCENVFQNDNDMI